MKRASTGWPGLHGYSNPPRLANRLAACLSGYRTKGRRILAGKGKHRSICCPASLVAAAYGDR